MYILKEEVLQLLENLAPEEDKDPLPEVAPEDVQIFRLESIPLNPGYCRQLFVHRPFISL